MNFFKRLFGQAGLPPSRKPSDARAAEPRDRGEMTVEALLEEGQRLRRNCVFLKSEGPGDVAGVWHHQIQGRPADVGFEAWLTVDTRFIPGFDASKARFLTVLTSNEDDKGRVEVASTLPAGVPLYAHAVEVLPPIDAIFSLGGAKIDAWLRANQWGRTVRYNRNFGGRAVVEAYEQYWARQDPVCGRHDKLFAALGGWPLANAADDRLERLDERLLVVTVKDCEPWVEAWEATSGALHVIQHIT